MADEFVEFRGSRCTGEEVRDDRSFRRIYDPALHQVDVVQYDQLWGPGFRHVLLKLLGGDNFEALFLDEVWVGWVHGSWRGIMTKMLNWNRFLMVIQG